MDEKSEISRLPRLTSILTLLQSKRIITATEIAEKFKVSKRTAYRDIKALEQAGVPIYTEEGKGYSLIEGYALPPIMFTEQEAYALITAEKLISRNKDGSLIDSHKNAIAKVKAVLKYSSKDKANLLSERIAILKNFKKETTSSCLSEVQLAMTNLQPIKIKYHALGRDEITQRIIEPQALYQTQENWILIAWCRLRSDYREFRLDRILFLERIRESFKDRNFDLMNYFMSVAKKNSKPLT
ncbi:YafY family protein [Fulvivirgaceae bacterium BMA10]|uniref:YafY family protein n=1 Tax=Splendidivirga corallicola TaxID=3051826 RepID=A0ABT8KH46_9BACT|nr:YafY family protein [Fulvivirgaceae bacterium BMA10]